MPLTVLDKICKAIEVLEEPGGASRVAVAKYVKQTWGEVSAALMKKAFATGVQKGKLVQNGQRFALVGVEIAPREGESVEKTIVKAAPEALPTEAVVAIPPVTAAEATILARTRKRKRRSRRRIRSLKRRRNVWLILLTAPP